MQLGDSITLAQQDWTVRSFSAAEHQKFDEIAAQHHLQELAIELETMRVTNAPGARQAFAEADIKRARKKLDRYLTEDGEIRDNLTDEQRAEGYEVSLEIEMLERKRDDLTREHSRRMLTLQEELAEARDDTVTAFMHDILKRKDTLEDFRAALTPEELLKLDEVVGVGKLRTGLSALQRRQAAAWDRVITASLEPGSGSASESSPPPQESPASGGTSGRSPKRSSG